MSDRRKFTIKSFILKDMKQSWLSYALLILSVILLTLVSLVPPLILKSLIDNGFDQQNSLIEKDFLIYASLYFASYLLIALMTIAENVIVDIIGQRLIRRLRHDMMSKKERLNASYFRHEGTGYFTGRILDDVTSVETLFSDGLISMIVSLSKIIGIIVSVFIFSPILGIIAVLLVPIVFTISSLFRKKMFNNQLETRKTRSSESNHLSESIDNALVLENLEKKEYREEQYKTLLLNEKKSLLKSSIYDSIFSPIVLTIKGLTILLIAMLVVMSHENSWTIIGISVGTFAASLSYISDIFSPIQDMGQELQSMQEGMSGLRRVTEFMNRKEDKEKKGDMTVDDLDLTKKAIRIDSLSFKYDDGNINVINNLSLDITSGEKIVFVGRTGAGKTTLFRLLLSILEPTEGKILIYGMDSTLIPNAIKRLIFGYVTQEFKQVPGTIKEQITLGDKKITDEMVHEAMRSVFLDEYVTNTIEGGYDSEFTSSKFSQGQLQLLNIARAIVMNPPILLLDEISANLDSDTESKIIKAITEISNGRTVLSISHRLSDSIGFDRMIDIENKQ